MTKPDHDPTESAFELHALTQTLPAVESRSHDESLLAVGVAPLSAVRPARPKRKFAERALPVATVLLAFTSIALAAHEAEHHHDDHGEGVYVVSHSLAKSKLASSNPSPEPERLIVSLASEDDTLVAAANENAEAARAVPALANRLPARTSSAVPRTRRTTAATRPADEPARPSSDRSFEELMADAAGESERTGTSASEPVASSLPLRPTTGQVSASFRSVGAALRSCDANGEGVVTARVTVNGATGRPSAARVEGASGAAASCMREALMSVRVDPFEQARLEVTFPYRL